MAYLFQAGPMAMSGNIILQPDYSLLAQKDSVSDIGETGTRFSNAYIDTYYGDGSNLTGLSAQIDVTASTFDTNFKLAFVQDLGTNKKLAGSDFIFANPTSNFNGYKVLQVSSSLSGTAMIGDGILAVLDQNDDDLLVVSKWGAQFYDDSAVISAEGDFETTGDISGSGTLIIDGDATLNSDLGVAGEISGDGAGLSNVPIALTGPDGGDWVQPMMVAASGSRIAGTTTGLFAQEGLGWNGASATFISPGNIFCSGNYTGGGSGLTNVPIALTGPDGGDVVQPMMVAASGSRIAGTTTGLFAQEGLGWNNASQTFISPGNVFCSGNYAGGGSGLTNVPIALTGPDGGNWIQPLMVAASGSRDNGTTTGLFAQEGLGWNGASQTFSSPGDMFCSGNYTGGGSGLTNVPIALTGPDGVDAVQPMMIAASGSRIAGTTVGLFAQEGLGWNNASQTFISPGDIFCSGNLEADGDIGVTNLHVAGTLALDQGSSQTIDLTAQPVVIQLAEDTSGTNGALLFFTGSGGDFMVFDTLYDWVSIKQDFSASCNKVFLGDSTSATIATIGAAHFGSGIRYSGIAVKTTNATLDTTNSYVICSGSAHTITLPGSPKNGFTYVVKRSSLMTGAAGDNDVTIAGGGKNIDGGSTIPLETAGAAVSLVYDGTTDQWNVF